MAQRRHWKQHWDPTAPLVFIRRLKLQVGDREFVNPGEEVTQEIRDALGRTEAHQLARLKRWWEAGFLAIKDWKAPSEIRAAAAQKPLPRLMIMDVGKGKYLVYGRKDGVIDCTVRGRKKADEALARLVAEEQAELAEQPEAPPAPAPEGEQEPPAPAGGD
jgi:hypothetical protein